jgi:hypothetical protein
MVALRLPEVRAVRVRVAGQIPDSVKTLQMTTYMPKGHYVSTLFLTYFEIVTRTHIEFLLFSAKTMLQQSRSCQGWRCEFD